jgi:hypothetical protein
MRIDREQGLLIGRLFESEFARHAHILGYFVNRHCEQLGVTGVKAPMLDGPFAGYRLPDFTLMKEGDAFWVEAKYKSDVTKYGKNNGEPQHGIDWPNWIDYIKISKISGQRGYLVLGEGYNGTIIYAPFKTLAATARHYQGERFPFDMAFWSRSVFKPFGYFSPQTGQMRFTFERLRPLADVFKRGVA